MITYALIASIFFVLNCLFPLYASNIFSCLSKSIYYECLKFFFRLVLLQRLFSVHLGVGCGFGCLSPLPLLMILKYFLIFLLFDTLYNPEMLVNLE